MALIAMGSRSSDWENLPAHLVDLVLGRLDLLDYLQFSDVCMPWNRVAKYNRSRYISPLLLISNDKEDTWNLYSIMDDKVLDLQLRLPNRRFCGSSRGWLISVEENYVVTLTSPFARGQDYKERANSVIRLPPLSPPDFSPLLPHFSPHKKVWAKQNENYVVLKASISADPILHANDCIVAIVYELHCRLAFIRLGHDTTWTYIDQSWRLIKEVVHVRERAYGIDQNGTLLTMDTSQPTSSVTLARGRPFSGPNIPTKTYLVNYNENEFLMVERYAKRASPDTERLTIAFKIFGLNLSALEWVEKETLGDAAIFLGDNTSAYVLASNFRGCQPNCIYFNSDWNRIKLTTKDCGVYNIITGRINWEPYTATAMALLRMTRRSPIWLL